MKGLNTLLLSLVATWVIPSNASSLVYSPNNPSFGGNALNGSVFLNNAQAQNRHKDPDLADDESALDDFNNRLQRALLNRITNTVASQIVDEDGNLVPGSTETADYVIDIVDEGDGSITVTTTEKATGESTIFSIQNSL